jgi:excisionase family DNA binding protein
MAMRAIDALRAEAEELPAQEIPQLLGALEELKTRLWLRLVAANGQGASPQPADSLLDAKQAAERLRTSQDYLYRHAARLPFTVRIGRRLRFSAQGLDRYIRQRRGR